MFYIHDHLGNTRLTYQPTPTCTNANVAYTLESVLDYYPYGKTLRSYTPVLEKYQSTHHQRDPETQYDHRNARNSDSDDGRFLSVDPAAAKYPAWSGYGYVMGNPIRVVDASGTENMVYVVFLGSSDLTADEQDAIIINAQKMYDKLLGTDKVLVRS